MKSIKNIAKLFWVVFIVPCCSFGQLSSSDADFNAAYPNIPQEKIFIHYNTSLLFSGEYLYYKVYNLNCESNELSNLSKIAYVELVDEDMQSIFKHKIRLVKSAGQSDFFIPATVPSGNYKLLGYTQWMKNGNQDNFFQGDIAIINPYQSNQERILLEEDTLKLKTSVQAKHKSILTEGVGTNNWKSDGFEKDIFNKRSKVVFSLKNFFDNYSEGTYSLSVRRIDTITTPIRPTSKKEFSKPGQQKTNDFWKEPNNRMFYPELRGELILGKITPKDSISSINNIEVAISIPGKEGHELKVINTDEDGRFYVNLEKEYNGTQAIVQVLGENRHNYNIVLDHGQSTNYPEMTFNKFGITPEMEDIILERSVHNQIENGYFQIKSDTLKQVSPIEQSYENIMTVYNLDDYTRFSTISETLVEVVELVWATKTQKGGTFYVKEHNYDTFLSPEFSPLIIVDGILIQDQDHLLEYNARNVKSISFLRSKYVVGQKIFQGVLMVDTIDRDYKSPELGEHIITVNLFKPEPDKKYYKQRYDETEGGKTVKTLDFRYQLLWEPNLDVSSENEEVIFFTSDIVGDYELIIEGFTSNGNPVSVKERFMVK